MTTFAYYLQCSPAAARNATREAIVSRINAATANSGRFNVRCVDAEVRIATGVIRDDGVLVASVSLEPRSNAITVQDYVMIDSIVFGAFKGATGQGWSVNQIRSRLAPTGSSVDRLSIGDVGEIRRTVSAGDNCNLASIQGGIVSRETVINGANVGASRGNASVIPQSVTDMPWYYKAAIGGGVVLVSAVAVGYVVRSFK